ncbi:hypothetical protein G4D82_04875 [Flavobacterium sp. CYK-4]|uniref:primase-helicase family protein n=1 Tax=Flavobacterium lotistagni TaxID=2709660 RepID=UPI00140BC1D1|nr:primase-helicase family protein [Flavobacterium lotistagni]NHM06545.1 hypothetical protein [Flavobacterium lotistagni]
MKTTEIPFWENEDGKVKISHTGLIAFLEKEGFGKLKISDSSSILVRMNNNRMRQTSVSEAIECVSNYLKSKKEPLVSEAFARGLGSYISNPKLELLQTITQVDDRDLVDSSIFYFKNCYCSIDVNGIQINDYSALKKVIWENRVLPYNFEMTDKKTGQFEKFCMNITNDPERFATLKSIIGYLLHRNKERGESKAIILYDEKMGVNGGANGGTGKTLLGKAIAICREAVEFNGKEIKRGSFFKNQRVNLTTDILIYDDLSKDISIEDFFTLITSGIEIEKKRQDAFYIEADKCPKILISSNYVVRGPGGQSDQRRRFEFEICNRYDANHTPEMEFGNRFFDSSWNSTEWNKFFEFMMRCVSTYLKYGLIQSEPINLVRNKSIQATNYEFVEFAEKNLKQDFWYDKRDVEAKYREFYPSNSDISPHLFAKFLKQYSASIGKAVEFKSTDSMYKFILKGNENGNNLQSK